MATIGNGYLSTVIGSNTIYVAGIFNGEATSTVTPPHRARVCGTTNEVLNLNTFACGLDLQDGIYYRRSNLSGYDGVTIQQSFYAHRSLRYLLVNEVLVNITEGNGNVSIAFNFNSGPASTDINFSPSNLSTSNPWLLGGSTYLAEEPYSPLQKVAVAYEKLDNITFQRASTPTSFLLTFYTVIRTSLDSNNPLNDALNTFLQIKSKYNVTDLKNLHIAAWQEIWSSGIEVGGNLNLAQSINSSLYYLLSSIREDAPYSLSPCSLSSNSYDGHVFWDSETWMYPTLALFYPDIAASILYYRYLRIHGAELKAQWYNSSYNGTMYPWRSAVTGEEVTPYEGVTGLIEQHISGDISFAFRQYWYLTKDLNWLRNIAWPVVQGIASFYASRVTYNETTGLYNINNIIPPDEYAFDVNNSYYTNVVALYSIQFAIEIATILDIQDQIPAFWKELSVAGVIALPFDDDLQIHLEFEGYSGEIIKQADVVLLAYPLMFPMTETVMKNDFTYYLNKTDVNGPAMSFAVYLIVWLQLNGDSDTADELFKKSYVNIQPPFYIWTEYPTSGATNFITGAGGFLQAVSSGYFGVRITSSSLKFQPTLPQSTTTIKLRGVQYLGSSFDVLFDGKFSYVTLQSYSPTTPTLFITYNQSTVQLFVRKQVVISSVAFNIHQ
eukprot:TRINITY_DN6223_c0_g1_i2.p1 TRINITY_DN6223_c0_g1~~TRINITY_DN6223_c0_g1_i2.p1  ORF type:complete len:666 (-),score=109.08 TRINITY_DN6223_c0_g1_i2:5-2002(-)